MLYAPVAGRENDAASLVPAAPAQNPPAGGSVDLRLEAETIRDIAVVVGRVNTTEDLPVLLTASLDAFGLIRAICRTSQDRSDELSESFAMAAASALHGSNLLAAAPSMPPAEQVTPIRAPAESVSLEYDLDEVTSIVVDLAAVVAGLLRQTGTHAPRSGDRTACYQAADQADSIDDLLTSDVAATTAGELPAPGTPAQPLPRPASQRRNHPR